MPDIILAAINAKWIHPSLALRLLKANLGNLEERCEILEFALRQPLNEKVEPILAARPRLLGFSVSIWNHTATLELLRALEENWNGLPGRKPVVVLGGPEVSWLPEGAEIFRHADYVIRGEGENAFRELCGFLLEASGNSSPPGKFTEGASVDLNTADPAYRLYSEEDLGRKLVYAEASRGCPFGCEFCLSSRDKTVRYFPLEPFLAEMETLIKKGARTIKFLDRTFNLDMDRAVRIMNFFLEKLEKIEDSKTEGERPLCVHFEMVPSRFSRALKEVLRRFPPGALRLELGIQTLNKSTANLVHRSWDSAGDYSGAGGELEALKFLRRETNAILHVDLIAGLPGEDLASFGAGFDLLWRTLTGCSPAAGSSFEIQLGILKCLPGTPIVRHNQTYNMRYLPEPPYEVIETGALPAPDLVKIKNFARFWEIIVNRNPFPGFISRFLLPGEPVFDIFMELSRRLFERFGRNWGIDREELRLFLEEKY